MFNFCISMQVNHVQQKIILPKEKEHSFKGGGGFFATTAELESNIPLSRAVIDMFGCDIPWVVLANNKQERIERVRRYAIVFLLAFLSPIAVVPALNRAVMKKMGMAKSIWSNNHKAVHLKNEFLHSAEKTKEGLLELSKKTEMVEKGKLPAKNKYIGAGIYWFNIALLSFTMGYVIPTAVNKMIRRDVNKDVQKEAVGKSH